MPVVIDTLVPAFSAAWMLATVTTALSLVVVKFGAPATLASAVVLIVMLLGSSSHSPPLPLRRGGVHQPVRDQNLLRGGLHEPAVAAQQPALGANQPAEIRPLVRPHDHPAALAAARWRWRRSSRPDSMLVVFARGVVPPPR